MERNEKRGSIGRRGFIKACAAAGGAAVLSPGARAAQGRPVRAAAREYGHVVVGGGFAGVAAALASAREGAKTCLLERTNVLGGLSTQGHVVVFLPLCDGFGRQVTFGIAEEFLRLPMKYSAAKPGGAWTDKKGTKEELSAARYEMVFDPGPMMLGLERVLADAGVDIFYDCSAESVRVEGGRIESVAARCGRETLDFRANAWTDATGCAMLAAMCGEKTVEGREGNVPGGWYYVVDSERRVSLRCHAGATFRKLHPSEAREYSGDDAEERSRHAILSRRAILDAVAGENARRTAMGLDPVHVFSIPVYSTLRVLARVAGDGASGPVVGIFSDWRRKGPVYPLKYAQIVANSVSNLLVAGRCISCVDAMWDVVRCLPACCVSGQAAGTAAAMLPEGGSFSGIDGDALRTRLAGQGVRLSDDLLRPDPSWDGGGAVRAEGVS